MVAAITWPKTKDVNVRERSNGDMFKLIKLFESQVFFKKTPSASG
jgi:hypothetical protein